VVGCVGEIVQQCERHVVRLRVGEVELTGKSASPASSIRAICTGEGGGDEDADAPGEGGPDAGADRLPVTRARRALTMEVTGWFSAKARTGPGIDAMGTKAELMNGSARPVAIHPVP
jgi:hypothetical protein